MQVSLLVQSHEGKTTCWNIHAEKLQCELVFNSLGVPDNNFHAYGKQLERVHVFKYLECLISFESNDTQAVWGNLKKVQRC